MYLIVHFRKFLLLNSMMEINNVFFAVKEMPKLVKLAPNGPTERSLLQQELKKRKRPIGKSHALVKSKPLTIGNTIIIVIH